jgi:hypothetical protein
VLIHAKEYDVNERDEQINLAFARMFGAVVAWRDDAFSVRAERRYDNQIRLTLYDSEGEVYTIATKFVDLDRPDLSGFRERIAEESSTLAFVKDYSENRGVLDALIEYDLVRHAGTDGQPVTIPAGFAKLHVVFVNPVLL